ncbi:MAG: hypothetical protein PHF67_01070 [Candidatus Nanoarchaeia archaeon]|nr:hypothetical protein [Candidatus Nanoarchaeia archaeon]
MNNHGRKDPSANFWDLVVERGIALVPGIKGLIGRAPDCTFRIWEGYDPDAHDERDYRTLLGRAVPRYQDFLRVEQNGSLRITHRTNIPTYVIRKNTRTDLAFPNSQNIRDYIRYGLNLRGCKQDGIQTLECGDEIYVFPNDLLILAGVYGFEIRAIGQKRQDPRLEDTQPIEIENLF